MYNSFTPALIPESDETFDAISIYQTVGKQLTLLIRTGYTSGHHYISDGVTSNPFEVFITAIPDGTALVTCDVSILFISQSTICTFAPRINNQLIYTFDTDFGPSALPSNSGNFGSVYPTGVNSTFFVMFTANNISQKLLIADGFTATPFEITIIDQPDQTSVVTCTQQSIRVCIFRIFELS